MQSKTMIMQLQSYNLSYKEWTYIGPLILKYQLKQSSLHFTTPCQVAASIPHSNEEVPYPYLQQSACSTLLDNRWGAQEVPYAPPQHNHLSTVSTVFFDVDSEFSCCQKKFRCKSGQNRRFRPKMAPKWSN